MNAIEIVLRGCAEVERDSAEWAALVNNLVNFHGWKVEHEGFNHDKVWFARADGQEYFRCSGSQYTKLDFVYDPLRWQYNATGEGPCL